MRLFNNAKYDNSVIALPLPPGLPTISQKIPYSYLSSSSDSCHATAAFTAPPCLTLSSLSRRSAACRQHSFSLAKAAFSFPFSMVSLRIPASLKVEHLTASSSRWAAAASPRSAEACRRKVRASKPGGGARQGSSSGGAGGAGGSFSCGKNVMRYTLRRWEWCQAWEVLVSAFLNEYARSPASGFIGMLKEIEGG